MTERNILFMMSGSIACAKATSVISEWNRRGHSVRVACTPSVRNFVGRATLEGLSGNAVFDDTFEAGRAMDHIALAQWANLLVVCPATANLLNKFAHGLADDAVTTLWQAAWGRDIPQFVVPAMNSRMWNYPATRDSVAKLKSWGVHLLPTATGDLACGEQGEGRMLEPGVIVETIDGLLDFETPRTRGRVLVTGGGTREAIDSVRYIGNHSTGRTAAILADELSTQGFEVTWLGAESALRPTHTRHLESYVSFSDLDRQLRKLLGSQDFDMVVHAAAVSDFSIDEAASGLERGRSGNGKLASGNELVLRLKPNPKLLSRIRTYSSNPDVRVVGFKLTVDADREQVLAAVAQQFRQSGTDFVVHNDLSEISPDHHPYVLHSGDGTIVKFGDSRELAGGLMALLEENA